VASANYFTGSGGTDGTTNMYRLAPGAGVAAYGNSAALGGFQNQAGGAGRLVIL
jgi:hypothetical protein